MDEDGVKRRIFLVNPYEVIWYGSISGSDVARQTARLNREGQIEPMTVVRQPREYECAWRVESDWPYAPAQLEAMRRLDWPTMLATGPEADVDAWLEETRYLREINKY